MSDATGVSESPKKGYGLPPFSRGFRVFLQEADLNDQQKLAKGNQLKKQYCSRLFNNVKSNGFKINKTVSTTKYNKSNFEICTYRLLYICKNAYE